MNALLGKTIGELVVERPGRAQVFETFGIDFCCGGRRKLSTVCEEKGIDAKVLSGVLELFDSRKTGDEGRDWSTTSLTELADHIEQTHHAYLKRDLPQLSLWTQKVANRHGDSDPRLVQLAGVFDHLQREMFSHMAKEEQVLFPLCRKMEAEGSHAAQSHCGSIQNPIRVMFAEHEDAGNALEQMASLTDNFVIPDHACNTYRAMLDGLAKLRKDMHQHVHKENNILFPKAVELERRLTQSTWQI